jgi:hypothetical protein
MVMSSAADLERAAARLERALDEAFSRYAGAGEDERVGGMAAALQAALAGEPGAMQAALLETLAARVAPSESPMPEVVTSVTASPESTAELAVLRQRVQELEAQAATADAGGSGDTRILDALLGAEARTLAPEQRPAPERLAAVVQLLTAFAVDLARAFLAAADRRGDTARQVDRFRAALRGELAGGGQGLAPLLDEIKHTLATQVEALPIACVKGAQQMLKELDPLVIEDQASESGGRQFGGLRPFKYRELWETFEKRHTELMSSEDLYRTYFDGPLRSALYRLREAKK